MSHKSAEPGSPPNFSFTARLDSAERRAPIRIDVIGKENVAALRELAGRVGHADIGSAAVYIRGTPEVVVAALTDLAGSRDLEQLNAALSLHREEPGGSKT